MLLVQPASRDSPHTALPSSPSQSVNILLVDFSAEVSQGYLAYASYKDGKYRLRLCHGRATYTQELNVVW